LKGGGRRTGSSRHRLHNKTLSQKPKNNNKDQSSLYVPGERRRLGF
jgi:hypothetical protein